MKRARLIEIFQSLQGEGPYTGRAMVFVRFEGCAFSCRYCDTPESFRRHPEFRVERTPHSGRFKNEANPVSAGRLERILDDFPEPWLSLTGGEPLQQAAFLKEWLPRRTPRGPVLLETGGILHQELTSVLPWIDVISMDVKISSATGMRPYWPEHEAFLKIARTKEVYVKAVVVPGTGDDEIKRAAGLVQGLAPDIPFVLQPVTPVGPVPASVSPQILERWAALSRRYLSDVRIMPQRHPHWGIL